MMIKPLWKFLKRQHKPHKPDPMEPWISYQSHCAQLGLQEPCLFLSFDCDTPLDARAALKICPELKARGIKATLAVPGQQLLEGEDEYRTLAKQGIEFMNHGAQPHAKFEVDRYVGITFYKEWKDQEVKQDIMEGHRIVTEITGREPMGFRAPHFGCYQSESNLNLIYQCAKELGYTYCSTTMPQTGLEKGPAFRALTGIWEIPVMGSSRNPTTGLDSWTYLTNKVQYSLGMTYFELMRETLLFMQEQQIPCIYTYYADPAHVLDQAAFNKTMDLFHEMKIPSYSASELVSQLNKHE